jgi:hypothetical protein
MFTAAMHIYRTEMTLRLLIAAPVLFCSAGVACAKANPQCAVRPAALREQSHVAANRFFVLLPGKDGSIKLRSERPVDAARLNELIDTMPARRIERERPNAN